MFEEGFSEQGLVRQRLLEQRRILVSGPLESGSITSLTAQLMMLDGVSSRDVEVVVNSSGGPLSEIFSVLDVIEVMRAQVSITCIGEAIGTAAGLVACGSGERRAARHARLSLRCDGRQSFEGTAAEVAHEADQLAALRNRYIDVLTAATGQGRQPTADEVDRGSTLSAAEALTLGLIDTVIKPGS